MTDFVPVLVAGILILAALLLISGVSFKPHVRTIVWEEEAPTEQPSAIGWVGYSFEQELRHIYLDKDFSVSYTAGEEVAAEASGIVSNGVAVDLSKKVPFSIAKQQEMESGKIKFFVNNSNYYGQLLLVLNNQELYRGTPTLGKHEIGFNTTLLKEQNLFEARASSSGWRFWAPTTYIIDAQVLVSYLGLKPKAYDFTLNKYEADGLLSSRLIVYLKGAEGVGNLVVRINGKEVYRDKPAGAVWQDLSADDIPLKEKNTIEFLAEENSKYDIGSAELVVFYRPQVATAKSMWYNLTQSQYDDLSAKNATLRFCLEKITGTPVGLLIYVANSRGEKSRIVLSGELREDQCYATRITKNDVSAGANRIDFIVSGIGGFLITNNTIFIGTAGITTKISIEAAKYTGSNEVTTTVRNTGSQTIDLGTTSSPTLSVYINDIQASFVSVPSGTLYVDATKQFTVANRTAMGDVCSKTIRVTTAVGVEASSTISC